MGTPVEPTSTEGSVTESTPDQGGSPGINPNWNEVLSIIPEQFHSQVTPHFQQWDQAAQSRIENVNKQFEDYKPFVEHGITREDLTNGLQLMHEVNNNPRGVYDALVQAYNFTPAEAKAAVEEMQEEAETQSLSNNPDYQKLQETVNLLTQHVVGQEEAKRNAKLDADLDAELSAAKKQYGDFDEDYVLAKMHSTGVSAAEAAQAYSSIVANALQNRPFAPNILGAASGSGIGLPSQATDVTKLSSNEVRNLVAEYARRNAQ